MYRLKSSSFLCMCNQSDKFADTNLELDSAKKNLFSSYIFEGKFAFQ